MKICAYVQEAYAKSCYKNECLDTRQFVGLRIIIDCLERSGYEVEFAGIATVHTYDVALVSITSDCDWWSFIGERIRWKKSDTKVLVGGAGVLHVSPFIRWVYAVMFGRGENLIVPLIDGIRSGNRYEHASIAYSDSFSPDNIYYIAQVEQPYQYEISLTPDKKFIESTIGCNHRCLFCGYTWQRKFISPYGQYKMDDSLFGNIADKERAMLDLYSGGKPVDFAHLRTTSIDGFSERIRMAVNKPITRSMISGFLEMMVESDAKPHRIKFYNICGYPTESEQDMLEFVEILKDVDGKSPKREKKWCTDIHCTPFRAMPATPLACAPMEKKDYREYIKRVFLKNGGYSFFDGNAIWGLIGAYTEGLPSVMLSALAHRGSLQDSENIARLCATKKFWSASSAVKEKTLSKYFDMDYLFGPFTSETLPSRYLRTYAHVEKMWGNTPLERETNAKSETL